MSLRQIKCRGVKQNMHEPKNRWEITARIWAGTFLLSSMKDAVNVSFYGRCRKRQIVCETLLSLRAKEVRNRKKHRQKGGGLWVCVKKEKKLSAEKRCQEQRG